MLAPRSAPSSEQQMSRLQNLSIRVARLYKRAKKMFIRYRTIERLDVEETERVETSYNKEEG